MTKPILSRRSSIVAGLVWLSALTITIHDPVSASAQESVRTNTSLKLIPADAAFYMSLLRNGEQIDALVNSKAFAKLMEIPTFKPFLAELRHQSLA